MSVLRAARAGWRLLRTLIHGVHGWLLVRLVFPRLDSAQRRARIAWWSAKTLRVLGIAHEVHGSWRPGAKLLVANHVSWLDIMAIHAVCPEARFVSKSEVGHWPLVGRLVASAGTLFLQRARARDALRVVHDMATALQAGETVAVFPEGTTGEGHGVLPFHANLLQAAIATNTVIQPVALRYADAHQSVSAAAAYVGDTSLIQSLWWIACADTLRVRVTVLPAQSCGHADRRALARALQHHLEEALA